MSVKEAIRSYLEKKEIYEVYDNFFIPDMSGEKCLGIVMPEDGLAMDFLMDLTAYMEKNDVDDTELELEGASYEYEEMRDKTIVYFPQIESL